MSVGCVLCMYRLYPGSAGDASGLRANDSAQYVIQSMSDAPDSSHLSLFFFLLLALFPFDPVNLEGVSCMNAYMQRDGAAGERSRADD